MEVTESQPKNEIFRGFTDYKQGAEARLLSGDFFDRPALIKERFVKKYRVEQLDTTVTKERLKAEVRGLLRAKAAGVPTPAIFFVDLGQRLIIMERLPGVTLKEQIQALEDQEDEGSLSRVEKLSQDLGLAIAQLHEANIIHGDLTSSNIILTPKLHFIDFGLSSLSSSAEEKAVDLYVLERALASTHARGPEMFETALNSYSTRCESGEVLNKLKEVQARGRKRTMVG